MRSKILLIISCFLLLSFTNSDNVSSLRDLYLKAKDDSGSADKLYNSSKNQTQALYKAYHGAALALKAKHHFNPVKKLEYLRSGLSKLNEAVLADVKDVEIRFLRFSVEDNIPSFISFTSHLNDDKKVIIASLEKTHPFYSTIKAYMTSCSRLSKEEKSKLN